MGSIDAPCQSDCETPVRVQVADDTGFEVIEAAVSASALPNISYGARAPR